MVLAVPPSFARRPSPVEWDTAVRARSGHGQTALGAGGDALGMDNGAHTVDAYWPPRT